MRDKILKLLIASMFFVSMEGMTDSMDEVSFHQSHHAHADDPENQWFPDTDGDDHDGDFCNHYCHAHFVGLITNYALPSVPQLVLFSPALRTRAVTHSTAPPTPPPNI